MDDTQTLELQLKTTVQNAISKMDELTEKLSKVNSATGKAKSSVDKFSKAFVSLGTFSGIKRLTRQFLEWTNLSIDFTEQLNLFNVVFGNIEKNGVKTFSTLGKKATQFQNQMNEAFGTNKTETLKYQALFQSMGENVGIPDSYSALMSETMTKLTYDLASLYNKSESTTGEALRAGVYAGQTKPLRSYGIDVTQTSMQPILNSLGITDRSVKQMSQAEKEILRYIATLKQAQIAMGDMANTIESPSNQLKVFKQQLVESKVALTSLFIGGFANILPYANAILMVVKELSKAIASFFGIELTDYNSGIASTEDAYSGIGESIDDATGKAKKFKREIMGFDQVHNINENDDSGSGSGASGGIDKRLLDAITGYDNGMDKVRMKATAIRDRIMEWLGFTKEIDPLTGDVSWKLKEGYSNLKLIGGIITALLGFKIFNTLKNIAKGILGVDDLVKLSGSNLTWIGKIVKSLKVSGWAGTIAKVGAKLKSVLPTLGKVAGGIGGFVGIIFGSKGAYEGAKKLTLENEKSAKSFGKLALGIGEATAGGALLGSVIPGVGTAIGASVGAVIGITSAIVGYNKAVKELAKEEVFGTINVTTQSWMEMLNNLNVPIADNTVRFSEMATALAELNTSFQRSSSELDFYGLKFGQLGQKISEEDAVNIKNAITNMCDSSNQAISTTTQYNLELWGQTFKKMSTLTDEEENNILSSILNYGDKQKTELKNAQDNITATYDNAIKTRGYLTDEEYNYIQKQLQKIRELTNKEMTLSQANIEFYKTSFADKNQKLDEQSYKNFKEALKTYKKERNAIIEETYTQELNSAKNMYDKKIISLEQYDALVKTAYTQRNKDIKILNKELETFESDVTENLKIKYKELLGENTKSAKEQRKLIEGILDKKTIEKITADYAKTGSESGAAFNNALNTNMNKYFPKQKTISIYANMDSFNSSLNAGLKNYSNVNMNFTPVKKADGGAFYGGSWHNIQQYANGGMPSHGSMFVAGERGAEIVGHINGRTEVLNQSQIASAIYSAVASAMSQYGGQSSQIDVHVHTDEGTVIDRINQRTKQTGICPINV